MAHDRITIDPDVMFGKPVIKGTRIPIERILRKLGEEDVHAAARFAADYMANEEVVPVGKERS
jgi:uncharacterized protein (DUF433 family)